MKIGFNYIKGMLIEDGIITFFLQTEGETDYWYWQVPQADVNDANYLEFVNNPKNAHLGCSVSSFPTLEDAKDNYYKER